MRKPIKIREKILQEHFITIFLNVSILDMICIGIDRHFDTKYFLSSFFFSCILTERFFTFDFLKEGI